MSDPQEAHQAQSPPSNKTENTTTAADPPPDELSALRDEVNALRMENANLVQARANDRQELQGAHKGIRRLKDDIKRLETEKKGLTERMMTAEHQYRKLTDCKPTPGHASSFRRASDDSSASLTDQIKRLSLDKRTLIWQADSLFAEQAAAEAQLTACRKELQSLRGEVGPRDESIIRLNAEVGILKLRLEELERENRMLRAKLKEKK